MNRALPVLTAFALAGCATSISLTSEGEDVRRVSAADTPIGCNLLGDVRIGIPPDAARPRTEDELVILMRNKAGGMGGSHVVVESTSERRVEGEAEPHWVGTGVAYACPEDAASPHEIPEDNTDTSGGEDMDDDASDDEGSGDDADSTIDDLLGE